jgi:hypothetical protein
MPTLALGLTPPGADCCCGIEIALSLSTSASVASGQSIVIRTPQEERKIIVSQPAKRPYGAKVQFRVLTAAAFGHDVEHVCLSLNTGAFLTIAPGRQAPWEGGRKFVATLEGFATAASAERAGRRLALSLLWMAVKLDWPLRLEYATHEPASVFERNRSEGDRMEAYGEIFFAPDYILGQVHEAYSKLGNPDQKLLLSMEIFCGARLESGQRAIFLTLVSALEPLAQPAQLGQEVSSFVDECQKNLLSVSAIAPETKDSLMRRLSELRHESIGQALRRLAQKVLPTNADAPRIIRDAYRLRSQLIHKGVPEDLDVDFELEARTVAAVIRDIYASPLLGQALAGPSAS